MDLHIRLLSLPPLTAVYTWSIVYHKQAIVTHRHGPAKYGNLRSRSATWSYLYTYTYLCTPTILQSVKVERFYSLTRRMDRQPAINEHSSAAVQLQCNHHHG